MEILTPAEDVYKRLPVAPFYSLGNREPLLLFFTGELFSSGGPKGERQRRIRETDHREMRRVRWR